MFRIKKIDIYIFKRFISLLFVTFMIALMVLLMRFLWRNINELVGKGLEWSILGEFFLYSALSLVPMALPLAILCFTNDFWRFGRKLWINGYEGCRRIIVSYYSSFNHIHFFSLYRCFLLKQRFYGFAAKTHTRYYR